MDVYIRPYGEGDLDEFRELYLEEYGADSPLDAVAREELVRHTMLSASSRPMSIRRCGDGALVGFLEAYGPDDGPWEVGVYVLAAHRSQGVGKAGVALYLDRLRDEHGKRDFVAKIEPGNAASIVLFEGLGFALAGRGTVNGICDESDADDLLARLEAAGDPDLARVIAAQIASTRREVLVYGVRWR